MRLNLPDPLVHQIEKALLARVRDPQLTVPEAFSAAEDLQAYQKALDDANRAPKEVAG